MDVTPLIAKNAQVIQGYKGGQFRISNTIYNSAVIVFPERVETWNVQNAESLRLEDFEILLADKPDVVLFGTGAKQIFLSTDMKKALKEQGLFVETMDTGAACRTFNVLMAEGRRVAAILLPV